MANKAIDKHYLLESLKDFNTKILLNYFQKKIIVSTVPSSPVNGDVIIYVGTTSGSFIQGHTYKYSNGWVDITPIGATSWGNIGGTLSNQIDLQNALDNKYDINDPIESSIGLGDNIPLSSTTWEPMTWSGLTSFYGLGIWTDGTNIYFSAGINLQYKLNGTTWESMTWSGFTDFRGDFVWTDDTNIYCSYNDDQYKLNGTTWEPTVWSGLTNLRGNCVWTDDTNIYYSYGSAQYKLNGTTWEIMTWTGLTDFHGFDIWTDGTNIYYSEGINKQYKLNGTTWEPMIWSGSSNFEGQFIWTDGTNIYYSYRSDQYKLNGTTWEPMIWNGLTSFYGLYIWTDGVNIYYSYSSDQYILGKVKRKKVSISTIKQTICDGYTPLVTQSNGMVVFDNLDPNYGYRIEFNNTTNGSSINVPKYTNVTQEDGTTTGTIKLTYTISGGTNGSSQFALRILK